MYITSGTNKATLSELSHNDTKYKGRWKDCPEGDSRVKSAHSESSMSKTLHSNLNLSSHAMVFIQIIWNICYVAYDLNNLQQIKSVLIYWASLMAQWVKDLLAMQETQETQVRSLGQEDPLEEEMATHFSILAWRIPWTEEPGWAAVQRVAKGQTQLSTHTFIYHRIAYFFPAPLC